MIAHDAGKFGRVPILMVIRLMGGQSIFTCMKPRPFTYREAEILKSEICHGNIILLIHNSVPTE